VASASYHLSCSRITSSDRPRLCLGHHGQLFLEPIAVGAKSVDLVEHAIQEGFRRRRGYSRPLQLPDLAALPMDLCPHPLDFAPNMIDVRHGPDL
jgi:hypothetical protein